MNRIQILLPEGKPKYVRCYDNGGKTLDRYTVVFTGRYTHKTGRAFWYLGMNASPFHGIGQHGETMYMPCDRPGYSHLGRKIDFSQLPDECKEATLNTYTYLWDIQSN